MPRRPTSKKLLSLRGSWRAGAKRHSPDPPLELPEPPRWLSGDGKRQFRTLARKLYEAGVLTALDGPALALLADAVAMYKLASQQVAVEGITVPGKGGRPVTNPAQRAVVAHRQFILTCLKEFALTPGSRGKVEKAPEPPSAEELEKAAFLEGRE